MSQPRVSIDVSDLPSVTFGPKSLLWWGTLGFIVIEGFTIVLSVSAYLYLHINTYDWPPAPIPPPDLLVPTVNTLLVLLLMVPMRAAQKAARAFQRRRVVKWLFVTAVLSVGVTVLRWFELSALNVRWDSNAYGSAAWAVVLLHGTLLAFDLVETATLALLFALGHAQRKHYSDIDDAALYQYYLSLVWIPLYLIIYWGPRVF